MVEKVYSLTNTHLRNAPSMNVSVCVCVHRIQSFSLLFFLFIHSFLLNATVENLYEHRHNTDRE